MWSKSYLDIVFRRVAFALDFALVGVRTACAQVEEHQMVLGAEAVTISQSIAAGDADRRPRARDWMGPVGRHNIPRAAKVPAISCSRGRTQITGRARGMEWDRAGGGTVIQEQQTSLGIHEHTQPNVPQVPTSEFKLALAPSISQPAWAVMRMSKLRIRPLRMEGATLTQSNCGTRDSGTVSIEDVCG